jgi:hypothetical protein
LVVCCYEDRVAELIGVKLLVRSVIRNAPGVPIHLCVPDAPIEFQRWVARQPHVELEQKRDATLNGWSAKPVLLLRMLDAGHDEAVWLDSDLLVAGDFRRLVSEGDSIVVTEELCRNPLRATPLRTSGWKLAVGRRLPHLINSAVVRALPLHRELLEEWARLMRTTEYQEAQRQPFPSRPVHLISDQDVLTGLLGAQQFAHLPVRVLRRGREIIHDPHDGYHPLDRLANVFRASPVFVHAQSGRAWRYPEPPALSDSWRYYNYLHCETSPYGHYARQMRDELDEETPFFDVRSLYGKACWAIAGGNPHLAGFLHACMSIGRSEADRAMSQVGRGARLVRRLASAGAGPLRRPSRRAPAKSVLDHDLELRIPGTPPQQGRDLPGVGDQLR